MIARDLLDPVKVLVGAVVVGELRPPWTAPQAKWTHDVHLLPRRRRATRADPRNDRPVSAVTAPEFAGKVGDDRGRLRVMRVSLWVYGLGLLVPGLITLKPVVGLAVPLIAIADFGPSRAPTATRRPGWSARPRSCSASRSCAGCRPADTVTGAGAG
jgi:hypothetical protein